MVEAGGIEPPSYRKPHELSYYRLPLLLAIAKSLSLDGNYIPRRRRCATVLLTV